MISLPNISGISCWHSVTSKIYFTIQIFESDVEFYVFNLHFMPQVMFYMITILSFTLSAKCLLAFSYVHGVGCNQWTPNGQEWTRPGSQLSSFRFKFFTKIFRISCQDLKIGRIDIKI